MRLQEGDVDLGPHDHFGHQGLPGSWNGLYGFYGSAQDVLIRLWGGGKVVFLIGLDKSEDRRQR